MVISPVELQKMAFENPDSLINHWLLPGTPMAFATCAHFARFVSGSDLDLAIVDPHFYETLDEQVRRWDRLPENRTQVYRYRTGAEFGQYRDRIYQKGRRQRHSG